MTHKFTIGANVYYEPTFGNAAARGKYKIVRQLPVAAADAVTGQHAYDFPACRGV